MRILLDESIPRRLAPLLIGHEATTVTENGWTGIKNGRLLALAANRFDVLLTADRNIEYQQNLSTLPLAILVLVIRSNRLEVVKTSCAGHLASAESSAAMHPAQSRRLIL